MALSFRRGSRRVSAYEKSNNPKNRKRAVDDEFLPIVPRALSFSFPPASPQHKEASAEERVIMDRTVTVTADFSQAGRVSLFLGR